MFYFRGIIITVTPILSYCSWSFIRFISSDAKSEKFDLHILVFDYILTN